MQNTLGIEKHCKRLWNRDLVACINMIHIIRNLHLNDEIPERFQHVGAERRDLTRRRRQRSEEHEERRALPRALYPSDTVIAMLPQMHFGNLELELLDSLSIYIQLLHF